jgi:hypothetical protein
MIDPATYLRRDNPRLLQLEADYAALDLPFKLSAWKDHQNVGVDIANFRADGAYLGQGGLDREPQYRAMWNYVKAIDSFGWIDDLKEDGDFGVLAFDFDGYSVSRDLCDSVMELKFILDELGYLPQNWLDIGSGYGRLAHRLTTISPRSRIICADAVPVSTFLCDFYSQYRGFADKCHIGTLTELESVDWVADIACNIHSWSECSAAAINFWLDKLVEWRVPYLFVVPHDERWVCVNEDGSIGNFKPLILDHGYAEIASRPKYPAGVDGLYPEVHYHMFARSR